MRGAGCKTSANNSEKVAEAMYRTAQGAGAGTGPQASSGADAGAPTGSRESADVIDAEVVEEEKK